ncbi:MAG: hypothetical protein J3K34DRAFT_470040 [Monoraphidium minutum]|nr:MAG: hypothetical protein J3K34DRAFT_470040 [Monoraphidium minutum]
MQQQLRRLSGQLEQLHGCTAQLRQRSASRGLVDRGVQADLGGGGVNPSPGKCAFEFRQPRRRINWRRVHAVNLEQMAAGGGASILSALEDTSLGDLDGDSAYNLSEGNLLKLLKLCQLQLQYLGYELARHQDAAAALCDDRAALAAGLAAMPRLGLGDVAGGLGALGGGVAALGQMRVGAILERVREEERELAKGAVARAVAAARHGVDAAHPLDTSSGGGSLLMGGGSLSSGC